MKIRILGFIMLLMLPLSSCNNFLDINDDPFLPQQGPPHLYLPQIIYAMGEGPMFDMRFIGQYVQHWQSTASLNLYDRMGRRALGGGLVASQTFRNHYWSIGSNVKQMQQQAAVRNFSAYDGIGDAILAFSWQQSTDQFGEMAYEQAWDNTRTSFNYDSQKHIYEQIDKLCDQALSKLNATGRLDPLMASGELLYNGDLERWKKFVYAVKARNANHISNKQAYNPARVIEMVDKAFASNSDNALIKFSQNANDVSDRFNFYGPTRANLAAYRPGITMVNMVNGTHFKGVSDPRMLLMFNPAPSDGVLRGLIPVQGIPAGQAANYPLMYGKYFFQNTAPYPLMTYAEMQFIKAEAAFRLNNKTLAYQSFLNAVRAHMSYTGVTPANAEAFIAAALPNNPEALELKHIMSQKYIAMYGMPEVWTDLRRYNYDGNIFMGFEVPQNLTPENNGKTVQRCLPTSFSEEDWNSAAFRANGGYEIDYHTKPMWFATNEN
jgi:hypothetical protein